MYQAIMCHRGYVQYKINWTLLHILKRKFIKKSVEDFVQIRHSILDRKNGPRGSYSILFYCRSVLFTLSLIHMRMNRRSPVAYLSHLMYAYTLYEFIFSNEICNSFFVFFSWYAYSCPVIPFQNFNCFRWKHSFPCSLRNISSHIVYAPCAMCLNYWALNIKNNHSFLFHFYSSLFAYQSAIEHVQISRLPG